MECADGSNVVIEYNSSPGVQGISKEIKKNMFDIVFEKIDSYIKKYAKYKGAGNNSLKEKRNCYTEYNRDVVDTLRKEWYSLSDTRQKILEKCLEIQPGMYYEPHGKDSPETGLDCSGLVKYVYREVTGKILPSMCAKYFTSFKDDEYEQIDKKDLLPGDIGIKNESTILNHCGIYAGDNTCLKADCVIYIILEFRTYRLVIRQWKFIKRNSFVNAHKNKLSNNSVSIPEWNSLLNKVVSCIGSIGKSLFSRILHPGCVEFHSINHAFK